MSNQTQFNLLNYDVRPYSTNPVYRIEIRIKNPYTKGPGRKKIFPNLWMYYKNIHFHYTIEKSKLDSNDDYSNEDEIKTHVKEIAKKIIKGERNFCQ